MNAIVRWSPFEALTLAEPFFGLEDLDRFVQEVWETWEPAYFNAGFEMYEDKDELVIKIELPGVKKEDFEVTLQDQELTVKAEKKADEVSRDVRYYAKGRYYGKYCRTIELPFPVVADKVTAHLEAGILEIRLPKAEEAKAKRIEVK